jgi:hypothetical protein
MHRALIVATFGVVLLGSGGAAAPPMFISPQHCPRGTGASQDPFYDVTAIQDRLVARGTAKALVVKGRYRAAENRGTWVLHPVRYRSQTRQLELKLSRNAGPRLRNPPCVNFSGSFTSGNPQEITIVDAKGRRITVDVRRPAGRSPRT